MTVRPPAAPAVPPPRALDAVTYVAAGALQKAAALLLVPFLVATLSPADFARYGLFTSLIVLLPRVLSLNVHSAPTRLLFDYGSPKDRAALLTSSLLASLGLTGLALVLILGALRIVPEADFLTDGRTDLQAGIALCVLLSVCVQFALAVARISGRARLFAAISVLQTAGVVALYVAAAGALQGSFPLVIASYAVGLAVVSCVGLYGVRQSCAAGEFRTDLAHAAFRFAAPTVVSFLAVWAITSSGRWVGAHLLGLDAIAGYILLTFLLSGMGMFGRALFDAALPAIGEAFAAGRHDTGERIIRRTTIAACTVVTCAYAAISAGLRWLPLPIPSAYVPGLDLLAAALAASLFDCLYLYGMQLLTALKRTRVLANATLAAAFAVLLLSVVLGRAWGTFGLISATTIGISIQGLLSIALSRSELSRAGARAEAPDATGIPPRGSVPSGPVESWALVMTPMQLRHMERIGTVRPSIVFYTSDVPGLPAQIERVLPQAEQVLLPANDFSRRAALRNPISALLRFRGTVQHTRARLLECIGRGDRPVELWCGQDRNVHLQLMARMLARAGRLSRVIAVDEGVGYYVRPHWSRFFWRPVYTLLSPLVVGVRYDHVPVLGFWRPVTEIWLRWPEMVVVRRADVTYRQISQERPQADRSNGVALHRNHVLLISSPLTTDRVLRASAEQQILRKLVEGVLAAGYELTIKPHPRDPAGKFAGFSGLDRTTVLDCSRSAEDLDYWSYDLILNFGSSVVMDVLAAGYPADRIITLEAGLELTRRLPILALTRVCHDPAEALAVVRTGAVPHEGAS